MNLQQLIDKLAEKLQKTANEEWNPEWDKNNTLSTHYPTDNGDISLFYYWDKTTHFWECEVEIYHDENEHISSNLEKFLSDELSECVEWGVCEDEWRDAYQDEWQSHGFRDEGDFWRWKEGRR